MIHAPALLPDEDANGYWGRVMRLNAVLSLPTNEVAFRAHVRDSFGAEPTGRAEAARTVSQVGNVKLDVLIRSHTLVPLHGAVLGTVGAGWCDDSYQSWMLRQESVNKQLYGAKLCARCTREDLEFWGFSYWRRSHQIPGLVVCTKHEQALVRVQERVSWRHMPHEVIDRAAALPGAVVSDVQSNPVLQRYADICHELLVRPGPASTLQAVVALASQAKRRGVAAVESESGTRLNEFAMDHVAGFWQEHFFRDLRVHRQEAAGARLNATLNTLSAVLGGTDYALTMAMLFESVDCALHALQRAARQLSAWRECVEATANPRRPTTEEERGRNAVLAMLQGSCHNDAVRSSGALRATPLDILEQIAARPDHCTEHANANELGGSFAPSALRSSATSL